MNRFLLSIAGIAVVCLASSPNVAQAQQTIKHVRHVAVAPPLTVTKRSWLDSGNVVAVGTNNSYLSENTTLNQPVYASFAPDRFGQSTLPGQFDLPFPENPRGTESGGIFFDN